MNNQGIASAWQLTNAPDVVRPRATTASDIRAMMQAEVDKEKARQEMRDQMVRIVKIMVPKWVLEMPKDGPGFLLGTTHGVAPETIYLGYMEGHGVWRQDYGAPLAMPRMFSAEVVGKKTLKIRDGIVRWSNVTLTTDVKSGDSGTLWDGFFTLDLSEWTAGEYRYAYMELDFTEQMAYFRLTSSEAVPDDDPANLITRWPLVKMIGAGTGADFTATIEDVCHDGIIKETAVIGPPLGS